MSTRRPTHVGILAYRQNSAGETELFVRSVHPDTPTSKPVDLSRCHTPYIKVRSSETDFECARRVGEVSVGLSIPLADLDNCPSFSIEDEEKAIKVRVFMVPASAALNGLTTRAFRGWQYAFKSLPSLQEIWVHREVAATREYLDQRLWFVST
ncbi:hypothetical protein O1611_g46 [Lasiodiplodia mahajangana]|uniref:Uncharacterized protein n=1 Tax=Lasiodiplodia mahajangana TaxID=1108764 RepID=A0ACC2K223_9PEZI|nr:hypothetical protein O1611_g46 [Lasiodiplodia mahajangana]